MSTNDALSIGDDQGGQTAELFLQRPKQASGPDLVRALRLCMLTRPVDGIRDVEVMRPAHLHAQHGDFQERVGMAIQDV